MKHILPTVCLVFAAAFSSLIAQTGPTVRFHTTLGDINVQLYSDLAPATVANFLGYVDRGDYEGSFIHRSEPDFVIQGGGYKFVDGNTETVPAQPPVVNEFGVSNTRGTIAMAKLGGDPNSATNQWFFNLNDANASNLDNQNGGFTVFGKIADAASLGVMDDIAALSIIDAGSPFDSLPVINYSSGDITNDNLVEVSSIERRASFFDGEAALSNGVYYLEFPNGENFGYYSYLEDPLYIYSFDLGYEYLIDAEDGNSGIYLYDFASGSFFYTSPTFSFPYLYDFTLNATLYYYQGTTSPRYFYNFSTGLIISK